MAFIRTIAAMTVLLVAVSSCANLFEGNLFENFDGPPDASEILDAYIDSNGNVSTADAADFVADLSEAMESPRFFEDLSGSDRTKLDTALASVYGNSALPATTIQEAAILAGEVNITGTAAGETINNIADLLTSDVGGDAFNDPAALMAAIIPDSAAGNPAAIAAILDSLVSAGDAYTALGGALTDTDGDGTVDGPGGANMTEVAQNAAVAIAISTLVSGDYGGSTTSLANAIAAGTVTGTSLDGFPAAGSPIDKIFDAGGLSGVFGG